MMNHEKCDCKNYDGGDQQRLIKLDLPEYDVYRYGGTGHTVLRAIRFVCYVAVLVLASYSLWRIRVIESKLEANDRLSNITRMLQTSSGVFHKRNARSIQQQLLMNSFGNEDEKGKDTATIPAWKKPTNKAEFDELVNDLFDKIKAMHDDPDRGHFDRNMKAVFQAWFPVFDSLLPRELREDSEARSTRDAREEYYYRPNRHSKAVDATGAEEKKDEKKSSESNSDESDKKDNNRPVRSIENSSNESATYVKPA